MGAGAKSTTGHLCAIAAGGIVAHLGCAIGPALSVVLPNLVPWFAQDAAMGAIVGLIVTSAALFVWRWTVGRGASPAQRRNLYAAACLGIATSAYIHLSSNRQLHQQLMGSRCVIQSQEPLLTSKQGATIDRSDLTVQQR